MGGALTVFHNCCFNLAGAFHRSSYGIDHAILAATKSSVVGFALSKLLVNEEK